MPTCASCRSEVAETDFFCWSCGKPWKGGAVSGVFEEQVYDEYAQRMREEYVRDRKVRSFTLAALGVVAAVAAVLVGRSGSDYLVFGVVVFTLAAVGCGVRSWANWRLHREARAKLEAEKG